MATHFNFCLIDPHQLALVIKNRVDNVLVLDSRSFLEYNSSHIINAVNVGCAKLMKRRLQQDKLSIKDFLAHNCHWDVGPETDIIVYDQATADPSFLSPDSFMSVFLHKLLPCYNSVNVLKGGYLGFQACYPNLCENEKMKLPPVTSLSQPCLPISDHGPTRILSFLYLGSQHDALNKEVLINHNISYELNVSTNCPKPDFIQDAHFMRIPVIDNYSEKLLPHFPQAFQFLDKVRESGGCALVHCLAGISRSATVAIAYVMKHLKMSSDEAYRYVKSKRSTISPNFNFLGQLLEYEGQLQMEKVLSPKSKTGSLVQCSSSPADPVFCFDHTKLSQVPLCANSPSALQDLTFNPCSNGAKSTNEGFTFDRKTSFCKSNFELNLNHDRDETAKQDHWTVRSVPTLSLKELNFMPCQASLSPVDRSALLKSLNISLGRNSWCTFDRRKDTEDGKFSLMQTDIAPKQDSDSMLFNSASDSKLDYNSLNLWPPQDSSSYSLSQASFDSKDYNRSDSTSTSGMGSDGSDFTDSWNEYHNCERETDSLMDEGYSTVPTGEEEYQRRKILGLDDMSLYAKYDTADFHDDNANCAMPTTDGKYMKFSMARRENDGGNLIANRSSSFNNAPEDDDIVIDEPHECDLKTTKCDGLYRARSCPGIMFSDPFPLSQHDYDHSIVPSVALRTTKNKSRKTVNQNRYSCSSLDYMDYSLQIDPLKSWTNVPPYNTASSDSVPTQIFTQSMIQVS